MRFLFSDVRNDAELEAAWDEDQPEAVYRLSLTAYVEAVEALAKVADDVRNTALRAHVDGMHFHEVAIRDPFEAERAYLDLARRVFGLIDERFDFGDGQ